MHKVQQFYDQPNKPPDPAWLVCLSNVLLFTLFQDTRADQGKDKQVLQKLFCNTQLALKDTRLFLTSRLTNVQALMTLVGTVTFGSGRLVIELTETGATGGGSASSVST